MAWLTPRVPCLKSSPLPHVAQQSPLGAWQAAGLEQELFSSQSGRDFGVPWEARPQCRRPPECSLPRKPCHTSLATFLPEEVGQPMWATLHSG